VTLAVPATSNRRVTRSMTKASAAPQQQPLPMQPAELARDPTTRLGSTLPLNTNLASRTTQARVNKRTQAHLPPNLAERPSRKRKSSPATSTTLRSTTSTSDMSQAVPDASTSATSGLDRSHSAPVPDVSASATSGSVRSHSARQQTLPERSSTVPDASTSATSGLDRSHSATVPDVTTSATSGLVHSHSADGPRAITLDDANMGGGQRAPYSYPVRDGRITHTDDATMQTGGSNATSIRTTASYTETPDRTPGSTTSTPAVTNPMGSVNTDFAAIPRSSSTVPDPFNPVVSPDDSPQHVPVTSVPPGLATTPTTRKYTFDDAICADYFPNGLVDTEDDGHDDPGPIGKTHSLPTRHTFGRPINPMTQLLPQAALCYQEDLTQLFQAFNITVIPTHDVTDAEASQSPEWRAADLEELNALRIMNTLGPLIDLPKGKRALPLGWVRKVKMNLDGSINRYKSRLVAKGFRQRHGIDYHETYSATLKYKSLRTLLALAVQHDLSLRHLDVVTAFLQADLEDEVYVRQPPGYTTTNANLVHRLQRPLYGIKQAPRQWSLHLTNTLQRLGFKQLISDSCLYSLISESSRTIVAVYVDDIIIASNNEEVEAFIIKSLMSKYNMKDLGKLSHILGMRVTRTDTTLTIDIANYISGVLKRFGMETSNPKPTPSAPGTVFSKDDEPTEEEAKDMQKVPYQAAVGCLIYASISARPDIALATHRVARHSNNPGPKHWKEVKRILRYLKGTQDLGIKYTKSLNSTMDTFLYDDLLNAHSDANFAGDAYKAKSTSGFVVRLCNGPVNWSCKLQRTVATSTFEAEYTALEVATRDVIWFRNLLQELGYSSNGPTTIAVDNAAAVSMASRDTNHDAHKHFMVRLYFVRDQVNNQFIKVAWVPSRDMIADSLTKPLPTPQFLSNRALLMGHSSPPSPTRTVHRVS
jgi:hypothetical protein